MSAFALGDEPGAALGFTSEDGVGVRTGAGRGTKRRGTFGGGVGVAGVLSDGVGKTARGGAVGRLTGGSVGDGFEAGSVAAEGAVGAGVLITGGVILR